MVNIADHLHNNWTINDFRAFLTDEQLRGGISVMYELTQNDNLAVTPFADEKFRTWKWILVIHLHMHFIKCVICGRLDLNIKFTC